MRLVVNRFVGQDRLLDIDVSVSFEDPIGLRSPRLTLVFDNGTETRRMPFPCEAYRPGSGELVGRFTFDLTALFWDYPDTTEMHLTFCLQLGEQECNLSPELSAEIYSDCFSVTCENSLSLRQIKPFDRIPFAAVRRFMKSSRRDQLKLITGLVLSVLFFPFRFCKIRQNRVTFLSNRRSDLTGNPACVYNRLVQDGTWDLRLHFNSGRLGRYDPRVFFRFCYLYATSRVVLVDDYFHFISYIKKPQGVKLIQLWHACGAFKTFGFSRLGKDSELTQYSPNHRQYDAAIVSGHELKGFYQEGFGLSKEKVMATGVPRTDLLLDRGYRFRVTQDFYAKYPALKHKKILLFAPTFRGGGKGNAYYPKERFDPMALCKALGEEYAILLKLHPYLTERYEIAPEYANRIVDCSADSELNDLLFVSDLVITDYSSVVFEAAIVGVPMLFYAFDLEDYIASRDFYIDFMTFVPGPIVREEQELSGAIAMALRHPAETASFKQRYLDASDGRATERVAQLVRGYATNE